MIITNCSNIEYSFFLPDETKKTENKASNTVETEVLTYNFTKVKSSNKTFLLENEIAEQTVVLTNSTKQTLTDIIFKDIMSEGATYVDGSVYIDGVVFPDYNLIDGFNIGTLNPNDSLTIKYKVKANDPLTHNSFTNKASLEYSADGLQFIEESNEITINNLSSKLSITKEVNKNIAVKGDTLHYTNTIVNEGTTNKVDLLFTDTIPTGSTFVPNSVLIDGVSYPDYNPETGFNIPDMAISQTVKVEFDVKVD